MPKVHSWQMRWSDFVTNRALANTTNLPSILSTIAARRHSSFGHIRRLPDCTPSHMALKLAVGTMSGDILHHDWNRPAKGHGLPGRARLCGIPDSLLSTHGLLLRIGKLGGRCDSQPVTWASITFTMYASRISVLKLFGKIKSCLVLSCKQRRKSRKGRGVHVLICGALMQLPSEFEQ